MKTLNPSIKHNLVIGLVLGIWGFLFAFFSRPFEHGQMDLEKWVFVSIGFSFLAFVSYVCISFLQKFVFHKLGRWNILLELSMFILFFTIYTFCTYFYYKSVLIGGIYNFLQFLSNIILNLILILTPILYFVRRYATKLIPDSTEDLTIKGDNKLDILRIKKAELVCISNAQNYVEIFYLENNELKSKLIRSSLKNMLSDYAFLIQVHRSHLINPVHFKTWKDSTTITLTQMDLPVSKNYKNQLLEL